jgi:hypothetical protein
MMNQPPPQLVLSPKRSSRPRRKEHAPFTAPGARASATGQGSIERWVHARLVCPRPPGDCLPSRAPHRALACMWVEPHRRGPTKRAQLMAGSWPHRPLVHVAQLLVRCDSARPVRLDGRRDLCPVDRVGNSPSIITVGGGSGPTPAHPRASPLLAPAPADIPAAAAAEAAVANAAYCRDRAVGVCNCTSGWVPRAACRPSLPGLPCFEELGGPHLPFCCSSLPGMKI